MKHRCADEKIVEISRKRKTRSKNKFSDQELNLDRLPDDFEIKLLDVMVTDLLSCIVDAESCCPIELVPLLKEVHKAIRSREPARITGLAELLSPQCIIDSRVKRPDVFYMLYQIGALLKKFPFPTSVGKQVALEDFYKQERENALFNTENYKALIACTLRHPDWFGCLDEIRGDIKKLMGDRPNNELVFRLAQHGPGTSLGFEGAEGKDTSFFKWMTLPYTVSPAAYTLAQAAIESNPHWVSALHQWFRVKNNIPFYAPINMDAFWASVLITVDYCRYTSVPKSFKTERGIAIEPLMNVFLQLGIKNILYARLRRRWNIDLTSQKRNAEAAQKASKDNSHVTVDLKGASNSVSIMAAVLLLPELWFDLLDDLRSRKIKIPSLDGRRKHILKTEMFSAMGNGFTFAIETIIFTAFARYAMRKTGQQGDPIVYGDDIIVPRESYQVLHDLLLMFGFNINEGKTFVDGPFRESCGADCFNGMVVTPLKIDSPTKSVRDLWRVHNSVVLLQRKLPWSFHISFNRTLKWIKSFVPSIYAEYKGPISESVDNYLFDVDWKPERGKDRTFTWWGITTRPIIFNDRSDAFDFRKLMVNYYPSQPKGVLDPVTTGGSAYDITIRGQVRHVRTTFTGYY